MKSLLLALPDRAYLAAHSEAEALGIDTSAYCSSLLVDCLLDATEDSPREMPPRGVEAAEVLDVAAAFGGFPPRSIAFAQRVVDEVFKLPDVRVRRDDRAIEIQPNFVRIEALLSRGGRSGIRISFYDNRLMSQAWWTELHDRHADVDWKRILPLLKRGQGNYCRAVIEDEDRLRSVLPLIHIAYELKFGLL